MSNRFVRLGLVFTVAIVACAPQGQPPAGTASAGIASASPTHTDPAPTVPTTSDTARSRSITINGAAPDSSEAQTLARLEAEYKITLPDGAYWYDAVSGAFGVWGQPTGALINSGLDLGPPMPGDASGGNTGVFVNNRQLQVSEVQYLSNLAGGPLQAGRYFIDAQGNAGVEGGPVLVNLVRANNARHAARNTGNGAGGGGVHKTAGYGSSKSWFDSDGKGCKMFITASGSTMSSGC